jgi:hypothetical protein
VARSAKPVAPPTALHTGRRGFELDWFDIRFLFPWKFYYVPKFADKMIGIHAIAKVVTVNIFSVSLH